MKIISTGFLTLIISIIFCVSCKNEIKDGNTLISRDIPKFVEALPKLSHNDMKEAFNQMNKVLGYRIADYSPKGALTATSLKQVSCPEIGLQNVN